MKEGKDRASVEICVDSFLVVIIVVVIVRECSSKSIMANIDIMALVVVK